MEEEADPEVVEVEVKAEAPKVETPETEGKVVGDACCRIVCTTCPFVKFCPKSNKNNPSISPI